VGEVGKFGVTMILFAAACSKLTSGQFAIIFNQSSGKLSL
jgi:hypothetical protein